MHVTTVHKSNDSRILYRECRSLSLIPNYKVFLAAPYKQDNLENIEIISLPLPFGNRFFRIIQSNLTLIKLFLKYRVDVIHLHDPELLLIGVVLAKFSQRRFVWDAHEDYVLQFSSKVGKRIYLRNFIRIILARFMKRLLISAENNMSGIIVATESIARAYTKSVATVVPNYPDTNFFQDSTPCFNSNYFLFIGATDKTALFEQVIEAIYLEGESKLIVAGSVKDPKVSERVIDSLGDRVSFTGRLGRDELRKVISQSKFAFVTYSDSGQEIDAFPTKFGEFLSSGLPIIFSPNKFLLDLNSHSFGLCAEGFDSKSLLHAISRANSIDEFQWRYFADNGKKWARINSWEGLSHQTLVDFYGKLK